MCIKHAGEGRILRHALPAHGGQRCIEVLALDSGPGIANLSQAMLDGVSSAGTVWHRAGRDAPAGRPAGCVCARRARVRRCWHGCGRIRRTAPQSVCYRRRLPAGWPARRNAAMPGRWQKQQYGQLGTLLMADGLGHGPEAAKASAAAVQTLAAAPGHAPQRLMEECHHALRPTRGAAMAIAELDPATAAAALCRHRQYRRLHY